MIGDVRAEIALAKHVLNERSLILVYHAAAEDIITFIRAAELLNLPLSEFRKAFQLVS